MPYSAVLLDFICILFLPCLLKFLFCTETWVCKSFFYKVFNISMVYLYSLSLEIWPISTIILITVKTCTLIKFYIKITHYIYNSFNSTFNFTFFVCILNS